MPWNENLDHACHAAATRLTGGLSPAAPGRADMGGTTRLAFASGKRFDIAEKAAGLAVNASPNALRPGEETRAFAPSPKDHRFRRRPNSAIPSPERDADLIAWS
jgi:hypothetical protein